MQWFLSGIFLWFYVNNKIRFKFNMIQCQNTINILCCIYRANHTAQNHTECSQNHTAQYHTECSQNHIAHISMTGKCQQAVVRRVSFLSFRLVKNFAQDQLEKRYNTIYRLPFSSIDFIIFIDYRLIGFITLFIGYRFHRLTHDNPPLLYMQATEGF